MTDEETSDVARWPLMRDILVFQLKLVVDGGRDLLLIPASLIAGVVGLFGNREHPEKPFHRVLALGKRSERWINLFGSLPRQQQLHATLSAARMGDLDNIVQKMEDLLVDQYEKGGITASAKDSIDKSLDALNNSVDKLSVKRRELPPGEN